MNSIRISISIQGKAAAAIIGAAVLLAVGALPTDALSALLSVLR